MNFSLKSLVYIAILLSFFSCAEKSNVESYIPATAKSIARIDLPKLKSKILTWENIKKHLFSSGEESKDYGIDFDRPIFIYSEGPIGNSIALLPISDSETFEANFNQNNSAEIKEINEFKYKEINENGEKSYIIAWKNDLAVICKNTDQLSTITKHSTTHPLIDSLSNKDLASIIDFKLDNDQHTQVALDFEFETGQLSTHLFGDSKMKGYLTEKYLPKTEKPTLCFTTDSCIFGLSTKVKPEILDQLVELSLPFLQEYGLLFKEQYEDLKPHLDGRIYIGVSKLKLAKGLKPEAKVAFGMADGYSPDLKDFVFDKATQYYADKEDFQFILPSMDYIIYSNHKESNTTLLNRNSIINLQMNRDALSESFFTLPKLFFGSDIVENFHFKSLEIDVHDKEDSIELEGTFKCKDQDENSLFCALELMQAIQKQDEI